VDGNIDIARQQRSLNFFGKDAACTDLFHRHDLFQITARRNFDQLNRMAEPPQLASDPFRLPASKLTAARP
jgi:hypothetical protein